MKRDWREAKESGECDASDGVKNMHMSGGLRRPALEGDAWLAADEDNCFCSDSSQLSVQQNISLVKRFSLSRGSGYIGVHVRNNEMCLETRTTGRVTKVA